MDRGSHFSVKKCFYMEGSGRRHRKREAKRRQSMVIILVLRGTSESVPYGAVCGRSRQFGKGKKGEWAAGSDEINETSCRQVNGNKGQRLCSTGVKGSFCRRPLENWKLRIVVNARACWVEGGGGEEAGNYLRGGGGKVRHYCLPGSNSARTERGSPSFDGCRPAHRGNRRCKIIRDRHKSSNQPWRWFQDGFQRPMDSRRRRSQEGPRGFRKLLKQGVSNCSSPKQRGHYILGCG